jgi:hypothetical protein
MHHPRPLLGRLAICLPAELSSKHDVMLQGRSVANRLQMITEPIRTAVASIPRGNV